jgi:hypothetical protein
MKITEEKLHELAENTAIMSSEVMMKSIEWQTADVSMIGDEYKNLNREIMKRALKLMIKHKFLWKK